MYTNIYTYNENTLKKNSIILMKNCYTQNSYLYLIFIVNKGAKKLQLIIYILILDFIS